MMENEAPLGPTRSGGVSSF